MSELQASLPREYYLPGKAWDREVERVWRRSWVCVGRTAELGLDRPGRLAVVEVAGESLLLTADGDGTLFGHANVCRHRGAQLCPHLPGSPPEPGPASTLRCGYHSWTYTLDGRLVRAPHTQDVDGLDPGSLGLHPVSVGSWGGFVFVRLTDGERSLTDELGDVPHRTVRYPLADLVSAHHVVHDVAANWKIFAENYSESYHCEPVHPELTRLVPAFADGGTDGAALARTTGVPHREGAWTYSFSGTSPRPPFPELDDGERVRHRSELVYPNLMLSLSAEHVASFLLAPLAADRTRITFDVLVAPGQAATPIEDCAGFWDLVNHQDRQVCESLQRGMSSSFYTGGWYAPVEQDGLIRRWLVPRLEWRGGLGEHP
jgi:Rieske 2Fe-2S family protein